MGDNLFDKAKLTKIGAEVYNEFANADQQKPKPKPRTKKTSTKSKPKSVQETAPVVDETLNSEPKTIKLTGKESIDRKTKLSLSVRPAIVAQAKSIAKENGISVSDLFEQIVQQIHK